MAHQNISLNGLVKALEKPYQVHRHSEQLSIMDGYIKKIYEWESQRLS